MLCTSRNVRPLLWLPLLLAALILVSPLCGQVSVAFKTQDPGRGFVEIGGNWHFHTGDDIEWAEPGYDDSARRMTSRSCRFAGWQPLRSRPRRG
jgi:hypothetical protein